MRFKEALVENLFKQHHKAVFDKKKLDNAQDMINEFVEGFESEISEVIEVSKGKISIESYENRRDYFAKIKIYNSVLQFRRLAESIEVLSSVNVDDYDVEKIDTIYPDSGEGNISKIMTGGYLNEYALNRYLQQTFAATMK